MDIRRRKVPLLTPRCLQTSVLLIQPPSDRPVGFLSATANISQAAHVRPDVHGIWKTFGSPALLQGQSGTPATFIPIFGWRCHIPTT